MCLCREACRGGVAYAYGGRRVGAEQCILMEGGVLRWSGVCLWRGGV